MTLEEIRLENFRCFYGKEKILFSKDSEQNITVVYAENGFGKTTLLNALIWCFYGITTPSFEKRDDILNHCAKEEGRATASVEVLFTHDQKQYSAIRYWSSSALNLIDFRVVPIEKGIPKQPLHSPQIFVDSILPQCMAEHFLFEGEHAEKFLGENNQTQIGSAVRDILGCSIIEVSIEDLGQIAKQFRKEIPTEKETERIDQLKKQRDNLAINVEDKKEGIANFERESLSNISQIKDIELKLREVGSSAELQKQRAQIHSDLDEEKARNRQAKDTEYRWLGENGRFVISKRLAEALSFLDKKEYRGRIPSPYNEEFVNDILQSTKCICGRNLERDSPEFRKVESLLRKSATQTLCDRVVKIRAKLTTFNSERTKKIIQLREAKENLSYSNERIEELEQRLAEIKKRLKGLRVAEISKLEDRHSELQDRNKTIERSIGKTTAEMESHEKEIQSIDAEILKLAKSNVRTELFARRLEMCGEIEKQLKKQLETEESQAQQAIRKSIEYILKRTTHKVLDIKMSPDYTIELIDRDGNLLPKSSGENQLLGLAFTSALIDFAKSRREEEQNRYLLSGTIAPLMLDSPFGKLDESYEADTANFIPEMAQQVILLLSRSQATDEILQILGQRIGSEYLLIRHNKEPAGDRPLDHRTIHGKSHQVTFFDEEFNGTSIRRVEM